MHRSDEVFPTHSLRLVFRNIISVDIPHSKLSLSSLSIQSKLFAIRSKRPQTSATVHKSTSFKCLKTSTRHLSFIPTMNVALVVAVDKSIFCLIWNFLEWNVWTFVNSFTFQFSNLLRKYSKIHFSMEVRNNEVIKRYGILWYFFSQEFSDRMTI